MNDDDKITLIITVGLFIAGAVLIIQLLTACTRINVQVSGEESKVERNLDSGLVDIDKEIANE